MVRFLVNLSYIRVPWRSCVFSKFIAKFRSHSIRSLLSKFRSLSFQKNIISKFSKKIAEQIFSIPASSSCESKNFLIKIPKKDTNQLSQFVSSLGLSKYSYKKNRALKQQFLTFCCLWSIDILFKLLKVMNLSKSSQKFHHIFKIRRGQQVACKTVNF